MSVISDSNSSILKISSREGEVSSRAKWGIEEAEAIGEAEYDMLPSVLGK